MHFGTFQLTDEAIDAPIDELRRSLRRHGIPEDEFRVPGFGETILVDTSKDERPASALVRCSRS